MSANYLSVTVLGCDDVISKKASSVFWMSSQPGENQLVKAMCGIVGMSQERGGQGVPWSIAGRHQFTCSARGRLSESDRRSRHVPSSPGGQGHSGPSKQHGGMSRSVRLTLEGGCSFPARAWSRGFHSLSLESLHFQSPPRKCPTLLFLRVNSPRKPPVTDVGVPALCACVIVQRYL